MNERLATLFQSIAYRGFFRHIITIPISAHQCVTTQLPVLQCAGPGRSIWRPTWARYTVLTENTLSPLSQELWRAVPTSYAYCTVLYCTVLYCTVLYCTVLYCTVLYLITKGFLKTSTIFRDEHEYNYSNPIPLFLSVPVFRPWSTTILTDQIALQASGVWQALRLLFIAVVIFTLCEGKAKYLKWRLIVLT